MDVVLLIDLGSELNFSPWWKGLTHLLFKPITRQDYCVSKFYLYGKQKVLIDDPLIYW